MFWGIVLGSAATSAVAFGGIMTYWAYFPNRKHLRRVCDCLFAAACQRTSVRCMAPPEGMVAVGAAPWLWSNWEWVGGAAFLTAQVEDLKALRDLLLYHVEDLEDIMSALKSRHDFASCAPLRSPHHLCDCLGACASLLHGPRAFAMRRSIVASL